MEKKITKQLLLALLLVLLATSCSDRFGDDLRGLGSRVEVLEKSALEAGQEIEALWTLLKAIQSNGYISNIIENSDGSFTVEMTYYTDPDDPNSKATKTYTLRSGNNGKDISTSIGVSQFSDGFWYWTINNNWLKDANGNMVLAGGKDGKDGIAPKVRIVTNNEGKRIWQISTDGGNTWTDMKDEKGNVIYADGKEDVFDSIYIEGNQLVLKLKGNPVPFRIDILTI